MKKTELFAFLYIVGIAAMVTTMSADELPLDSQGLIEKMDEFESTELREAKRRIEEKKMLVIEALIAHYKREDANGNQAAALAIRQEIEKMDNGQRRFTQGLNAMATDANGPPPEKPSRIPDTATRIGSRYYQLFGDRVTREDAKARCLKMGGRLAIINDDRIYEKYVDVVRKTYKFSACWTAGKFDKAEKKWVWEGDEQERFDEDLIRNEEEIESPDYDFLCMDITRGELFSKPSSAVQTYLCEWEEK